MFSLESPQRGDSSEYTQYTISQHKNVSQICNYGISSKGLKEEFETAVVNEPSVFEPFKFYCIFQQTLQVFSNKYVFSSHLIKCFDGRTIYRSVQGSFA